MPNLPIADYVLEWLHDPDDAGRRCSAANRLGEIGTPLALSFLMKGVLNEKDEWTLASMLGILADEFPDQASASFAEALASYSDPGLTFTTLLLATNEAIQVPLNSVTRLLDHEVWFLRLISAEYLVRSGEGHLARETLEKLLVEFDADRIQPIPRGELIGKGCEIRWNIPLASAFAAELLMQSEEGEPPTPTPMPKR